MTISEIKDILVVMRENKVMQLKVPDLELLLHPDAFAEPKTDKKPDAPELDNKKKGKLGLTRLQEFELFGVVREDDFDGPQT